MNIGLYIWLLLVIVIAPIFTSLASMAVLPNIAFRHRLLISLPQAILFVMGHIGVGHFGWFSRWQYLDVISIIFGIPLGFILIRILAKVEVNQGVGK